MKFPVKTYLFDVVIPTKNSGRTLRQCLEALVSSDIPIKSIILIDKYSRDNTAKIAKDFGCKIIQSDANYSQAIRLGAKHASTNYILILDSDIMIDPHFYEKLKAYLRKYFIVKGVHRDALKWKKLSDLWFELSSREPRDLEAAFIKRKKFLTLTKSWDDGHLDAEGDSWLHQKCKTLSIPVIQSRKVISQHLVFNYQRSFKQVRWYGKSARKSKFVSFQRVLGRFFKSFYWGLLWALKLRDFKILPFFIVHRFYFLWGYLFD